MGTFGGGNGPGVPSVPATALLSRINVQDTEDEDEVVRLCETKRVNEELLVVAALSICIRQSTRF